MLARLCRLFYPFHIMWRHVPVKLEPTWRVSVSTHCCTGLPVLSQSLIPISFPVTRLCQWNMCSVDVISLFTNVYRIKKQYKLALASYICCLVLSWLQFTERNPLCGFYTKWNSFTLLASAMSISFARLIVACIAYRMGLLNFLHC